MKKTKAKTKPVITVKVRGFDVLSGALDDAILRGMNRYDKYSEEPLTDGQRNLLSTEIVNSFWLALDDRGAEIR